jgi:hypothetical protein
MQAQEELVLLIEDAFSGMELINLEGFKKMTEEHSSTIYLCVFSCVLTFAALLPPAEELSDLLQLLGLLGRLPPLLGPEVGRKGSIHSQGRGDQDPPVPNRIPSD